MKNNELFIGKIMQITGEENISGKASGLLDNPLLEILLTEKSIQELTQVKIALLHYTGFGIYKDLEDRKEYHTEGIDVGDKFVYPGEKNKYLFSINLILPEHEKGKNLTRRKALKRFKEYKIQNNII